MVFQNSETLNNLKTMVMVNEDGVLKGLKFKTTLEKIEARHMATITTGIFFKKTSLVSFGERDNRWKTLVSKVQAGDEFWVYRASSSKWQQEEGYALVRSGRIIGWICIQASHVSPADEGIQPSHMRR